MRFRSHSDLTDYYWRPFFYLSEPLEVPNLDKMPEDIDFWAYYGTWDFSTDISSLRHFGMETFRHGDFSTQGHFRTGIFWHGDMSARGHYETGTFGLRNISTEWMFRHRNTFWHRCQNVPVTSLSHPQCQNIPVPVHVFVLKCPCAKNSLC